MTDDQIKKANELTSKIKEIENFLFIIEPHKNITRGNESNDILAKFRIKTEKSVFLFGRWNVGVGSHEKDIQVPNSIIDDLYAVSSNHLNELKQELENL